MRASAKWQRICKKLEELHVGLINIETCYSGKNPPLPGVLPLILAIMDEYHNLDHCCVNVSYNVKLLMQSELDVTLVKFFH